MLCECDVEGVCGVVVDVCCDFCDVVFVVVE